MLQKVEHSPETTLSRYITFQFAACEIPRCACVLFIPEFAWQDRASNPWNPYLEYLLTSFRKRRYAPAFKSRRQKTTCGNGLSQTFKSCNDPTALPSYPRSSSPPSFLLRPCRVEWLCRAPHARLGNFVRIYSSRDISMIC